MKNLLLAIFFIGATGSAFAQNSLVLPAFRDAVKIFVEDPGTARSYVVNPQVRALISIFEKKKITPDMLEPYLDALSGKNSYPLGADDKFDGWIKNRKIDNSDVPELTLHAFGFDVIEESDDFFNDDIYCYFFVTDGVIPTGKVTGIYKGVDEGETFFFNEVDRAIYPLLGVPAKKPENHLIIDYGIIESDGDDIKNLQKLSSIIIDIAIAVYSQIDPQNGEVLANLRKEVKALADLLLSMNDDDRLANGSFGYTTAELSEILREHTYVEFKKTHKKESNFDDWEYHLRFRLIRN
jgi:hypothetical protein